MAYTFHKTERLCSQALIERLFVDGERLMVFPYSVRYRMMPAGSLPDGAQVLIVAPKRRFRHAVDRNRVKRLTREAYRYQKAQLYEALTESGRCMTLSLTYVGNEIMTQEQIMRKMERLITTLCGKVEALRMQDGQ